MDLPKERWDNDEEGELDDIVVPDVKLFRMERMDSNYWWVCLYTKDGREIHMDLLPEQNGITLTRREY
mgnify:CR=1 FL=1